jgi:D-serine deaminase-like pyridoxal phosphate-dependent protein
MDGAIQVIGAVEAHAAILDLAGIECYEGTINLKDPDEGPLPPSTGSWTSSSGCLARAKALGAFGGRSEVLLTAGGSSYFDRVAARFAPVHRGPGTRIVLRGGSYLFRALSAAGCRLDAWRLAVVVSGYGARGPKGSFRAVAHPACREDG